MLLYFFRFTHSSSSAGRALNIEVMFCDAEPKKLVTPLSAKLRSVIFAPRVNVDNSRNSSHGREFAVIIDIQNVWRQ